MASIPLLSAFFYSTVCLPVSFLWCFPSFPLWCVAVVVVVVVIEGNVLVAISLLCYFLQLCGFSCELLDVRSSLSVVFCCRCSGCSGRQKTFMLAPYHVFYGYCDVYLP